MRGKLRLRSACALLGCVGLPATAGWSPAAAQGSYSTYDESASAALARYVRALASNPNDFRTLVNAGRAALEVGDMQAAAGFFARADDINPRSPLPQAGMGAVSAASGDPQSALAYFTRAQQLGASVAQIGCDRGLAFDLMGRQADAQSDYRLALSGPDADEARRRLALSFAISGDRTGALNTLSPLMAKRDPGAARTRAFVLALTGDSAGAMAAFDAALPGSWSRVQPFLVQLPTLAAGQKAAAANLGIFPEAGGRAFASARIAAPAQRPRANAPVHNNGGDRLADIDALLSGSIVSAQIPQAPQASVPMASTQVSYAPQRATAARSAVLAPRKIWLQLASGSDPNALPSQFERMKSRNRDLFDGISGYVAKSPDRARLVVGPFRSASDAEIFAEDLESVEINAFKWSNSETDQIVPIRTH